MMVFWLTLCLAHPVGGREVFVDWQIEISNDLKMYVQLDLPPKLAEDSSLVSAVSSAFEAKLDGERLLLSVEEEPIVVSDHHHVLQLLLTAPLSEGHLVVENGAFLVASPSIRRQVTTTGVYTLQQSDPLNVPWSTERSVRVFEATLQRSTSRVYWLAISGFSLLAMLLVLKRRFVR